MFDIIKTAFELTKKHALILIGAVLSVFVISMIFSFITAAFASVPVMSFFSNIASLALQLYLGVALLKLALCIIDGKEPEFKDIKPNLGEMLKYFSAGLFAALFFLVVFMLTLFFMGSIGVLNANISTMLSDVFTDQANFQKYTPKELAYGFGVLFVMAIPALLLYLRVQFANYIVVDKENQTAFTAIMHSIRISKGYLFYIVLAILSIIVINILGLLVFFVGLIFTIPMSFIILLLLYRNLNQNYEEDHAVIVDEE